MSFPCLGSKHALSGASSRAQQSVVARVWFARGGSGRRCSPGASHNKCGLLVSLVVARRPGSASHAQWNNCPACSAREQHGASQFETIKSIK